MGWMSKFIESTYDFRMKFSRRTGLGIQITEPKSPSMPPVDFYSLKAVTNQGSEFSFENCRGRKVLLVNLASKCGFTPQYKELQQLHLQNDSLMILGFPSNNFAGQEPGSDEEIARFCEIHYQVSFPIFKKGEVKGPSKQPVYQWLTDPGRNGWNSQEPGWNFYKYLVDETGRLVKVFSSSVSPSDIELG